jgi:LacI family transcriptional regulator
MKPTTDPHDVWIVLTDGDNVFDAEFRTGALAFAHEQGLFRIRLASEWSGLGALMASPFAKSGRLAVITHATEDATLKALAKADIPSILLGAADEPHWRKILKKPVTVCSVDNQAVGRMAADYLYGQNRYASYVYTDGSSFESWQWWTRSRYEAFVETLAEHGFTDPVPHFAFYSKSPDDDALALVRLIRTLPQPVAVFACNDRIAAETVAACTIGGLHVPDDVAVIGVDNEIPVCESAPTAISSIKIEHQRLGRTAMNLMMHMIKTGQRRDSTILCPPVRVIERDSTKRTVPNDRFVAKAVEYIRVAAPSSLDVTSAVRASGASRSYLEKRFRADTGRSIIAAIHARLLGDVKRLLLDTDRSVSFIAAEAGFPSPSALCALFKREIGMTPNEFRASRRVKA